MLLNDAWSLVWDGRSLALDRGSMDLSAFSPDFRRTAVAPLPESESFADGLDLRVFLDRSIVEVFALDGEVVLTSLLLPSGTIRKLRLHASGDAAVTHLHHWPLLSIWAARPAEEP